MNRIIWKKYFIYLVYTESYLSVTAFALDAELS